MNISLSFIKKRKKEKMRFFYGALLMYLGTIQLVPVVFYYFTADIL